MRWAIITGMYNVADLAADFCRYHLALGVDQIIAADYGSTDGTLDLLGPFIRAGVVRLVTVTSHRFVEYDPSNVLLSQLRTENGADWVSFLDPDEFLTGPANLKDLIREDFARGREAIAIPRFNLTAVGTIPEQVRYLSHLTLKIVATDRRVSSAAAPLSSPWIFSRLPPKVMVRVQSPLTIATGDHDVHGGANQISRSSSLEILHLPLRGYSSFQRKVEDTARYLAANPEFGLRMGWHWRRWIDLLNVGQLPAEYEKQFLDSETAAALLAADRIAPERTLADWIAKDSA